MRGSAAGAVFKERNLTNNQADATSFVYKTFKEEPKVRY